MSERISKKIAKPWKRKLGYSPAQETASGAGYHEKSGKARRRDERRKARRAIQQEDY